MGDKLFPASSAVPKVNKENEVCPSEGGEAREVLDWLQSFWGGACLVDQQCLTPLSRCDHSNMLGKLVKGKFGECTPVTETTAIGIGIGLLLLKACIIMICCSICRGE